MKLTDIEIRLSGAGTYNGAQTNPNLSLGNYPSSTVLKNYKAASAPTTISGVTITATGVGSGNPVGNGTLTFTEATNELQWTPPGGTIGPAVAFTADATKILYGVQGSDTTSGYIQVTVVYATLNALTTNLTNTITISDHADLINALFGNISSAEASAGGIKYRAVFLRNSHATESLDAAKLLFILQGGNITPMPNETMEFAVEDPSSRTTGFIQTIANESTAPVGLTWSTVSTEGTALAIAGVANLSATQTTGLWLKRTVTAGAGPYPNNSVQMMVLGDIASIEN